MALKLFNSIDRDKNDVIDRQEFERHLSFDALKGAEDRIGKAEFVHKYVSLRCGWR